jgi:hypothetical protein
MDSLSEVSEQLYISRNTLKSHIKTIYRELGVSRRRDAVIKGRELGLIPQLWQKTLGGVQPDQGSPCRDRCRCGPRLVLLADLPDGM